MELVVQCCTFMYYKFGFGFGLKFVVADVT